EMREKIKALMEEADEKAKADLIFAAEYLKLRPPPVDDADLDDDREQTLLRKQQLSREQRLVDDSNRVAEHEELESELPTGVALPGEDEAVDPVDLLPDMELDLDQLHADLSDLDDDTRDPFHLDLAL